MIEKSLIQYDETLIDLSDIGRKITDGVRRIVGWGAGRSIVSMLVWGITDEVESVDDVEVALKF